MVVRVLALLAMSVTAFGGSVPPGARTDPPQTIAAPPPPVPQSTGYTVSGRAVCADTQRAARFAQVTLIAAGGDGSGGGRRLSTRTDLDGNFNVANVPAGDYYVTGSMTGYINSSNQVQNAISNGTDPGAVVAGVPLVHVSAGGASAALNLQRGAVIAGAVQWDDGSPAAGVSVAAQPVPATTGSPATGSTDASQAGRVGGGGFGGGFLGGFGNTQTDDRGRFRLSGLAAGQYYVRASVQAAAPQAPGFGGNGRNLSLGVYAPDKVRRTDATVLTLTAGEERPDVNVVLGLAGMHNVSGVVSSSSAAVRSGTVTLSDQTDSTLSRTGTIGADGGFVVPYVPPGTYTLRATASSQANSFGRGGGQGSDPAARFQPLQESITVTDSDLGGVNLTVTTSTTSP